MKVIKETEAGLFKLSKIDAVTGNVLADMLEVRHIDLMRTIKKVMRYEENRKSHCADVRSEIIHIEEEKALMFNAIFKKWEYTNDRGRKYKTYIMNEDALYLVIANTQSRKAHELKVWFKSEFNKMKIERKVREYEKIASMGMTDAIKVFFLDYLIGSDRQTEGQLYSTINSKIRKKATGKPKKRGSDNNHDTFTVKETAIIEALRQQVPQWIVEAIQTQNASKAMKQYIYDRIEDFNPVYIGHNMDSLLDDDLQSKPKQMEANGSKPEQKRKNKMKTEQTPTITIGEIQDINRMLDNMTEKEIEDLCKEVGVSPEIFLTYKRLGRKVEIKTEEKGVGDHQNTPK